MPSVPGHLDAQCRACWPRLPSTVRADVIRLEILSRQPANDGRPVGTIGEFEILRGKIHGEIDPADPHNKDIQDLALAPRNERGKVAYVATFALAKPVDMTKAARVLLYQVVNRGNGQVTIGPEGYISLISGWQGDVVPTQNNQTIVVPVARARDGGVVKGPVLARFIDVPDGASTAPIRLASLGTPQPYLPANLSEPGAVMTMYSSETRSGAQQGRQTIARSDWAFANCEKVPFPGTPDPTRVCLRDGFRSNRAYQLVYTAKDSLVLGVGLAATRDIVSFFRYADRDRDGTAESRRRGDRPGRQHWRFAIRKLHPYVHPSWIQSGRVEPNRLGRCLSANRGTADTDESALRACPVARRACTSRAATGSCGGDAMKTAPED